MPDDVVDRIFKPFFSTKRDRGTELWLAAAAPASFLRTGGPLPPLFSSARFRVPAGLDVAVCRRGPSHKAQSCATQAD
ncbi:MAG: hypothetical protein H7305_10980 [Gemmatimonadaceae bacterium]|nr:hypothetical protein [Gemmatimonadaceae bacterium]